MNRRIDDLQLLARGFHQLRLDGQRLDLRNIVVVHFLVADNLEQSLRLRLGFVHLDGILIAVGADAGKHLIGVLRRHLRAVLPVYFVSIVFRRIMACRDVDARCTPKLAHRIGKLRRRS